MTKTNKKLTAIALPALFILIGFAVATIVYTVVIPSIGQAFIGKIEVTWVSNSTEVTEVNWGFVESGTPTVLSDLICVTNVGNIPVTLTLSYTDPVNVTITDLSWNYTDTVLNKADYVYVQLSLTATLLEETFSFNTVIDAND